MSSLSFKFWIVFIVFLGVVFGIPYLRDTGVLAVDPPQTEDQEIVYLAPTAPPELLAENAEIVYLSTYGANEKEKYDENVENEDEKGKDEKGKDKKGKDDIGVIHLEIDRPNSKVLLVLFSYNTVRWRINKTPGTNISGIVASGNMPPEVFASFDVRGYDAELPTAFDQRDNGFKSVEARMNQLFGVNRLDVFRGSMGMVGKIRVSYLSPIEFGPIDKSLFFAEGRRRVGAPPSQSPSGVPSEARVPTRR